jgi:hypothetical protein
VRSEVTAQLAQMKQDGIIEPAASSYINPLTVDLREGKSPRICLDARRVNKWMIPDRTRVQPISELLQRFHGFRYVSTIDSSSAFLQIELAPELRKYTAFLFVSQVWQFTRMPYGYKNSFLTFIRAFNLALGSGTCDYALCHVDDITVHSSSFNLHIEHLKTVIGRLTAAGFTINARKCNFCKTENAFLGHVISNGGVAPDQRRIEAILSYPAPKNQHQLRQFLGVCNYRHRFTINYASHVAPLLHLLNSSESSQGMQNSGADGGRAPFTIQNVSTGQ